MKNELIKINMRGKLSEKIVKDKNLKFINRPLLEKFGLEMKSNDNKKRILKDLIEDINRLIS